MLDLDALNPAPEDERVEVDALAAMVGKFALSLVAIGAFFGLGVAALTGSPTDERVVYVARTAQAEPVAQVWPVVTERQVEAQPERREAAAEPKAKPARSSREGIDARYRELMAASERDQQILAAAVERGETMVQAEDGSWVPESFYDEPAEPERKASASSLKRSESSRGSSSSGSRVAEDGSRVPSGFYDRTDYNRNGVADQCEGWPKNPNPDDVAAGRK